MSRLRSNPDSRTNLNGTLGPWHSTKVYNYLCQLFRRSPGELALTEKEFIVSRAEYVGRATQNYWARLKRANRVERGRHRAYTRKERSGVLDATPTKILEVLKSLYYAEFSWIILREEFHNRSANSTASILAYIKSQYLYLPQASSATLKANLQLAPFGLACEEVAEILQRQGFDIKAESLPILLSPSQRRRAGIPPWLTEMFSK